MIEPQLPAPPPAGDGLACQNHRTALALEALKNPPPSFLRPGELEEAHRPRTAEEQQAFVDRFWGDQEQAHLASLETTRPLRIKAAWRIVREMARLKNMVEECQYLIEGLPWEPDPWIFPTKGQLPDNPQEYAIQKRWVLALMPVIRELAEGLPLLPPAKTNDRPITEDHQLISWCRCAQRIADYHAIGYRRDETGLPERSSLVHLALQQITELDSCREHFPSPQEIMDYEAAVVEETIIRMTESNGAAQKFLTEYHGLRPREIKSILAICMKDIRSQADYDIEEKRALMEHWLQGYIGRAQESFDLNNEMKAMKTLTQVQGLTRTDPEDADKEFLVATTRISLEPRTVDIPALRDVDIPALPAPDADS